MADNPGPTWHARLRPGSNQSPGAFTSCTFALLPIELSLLLVLYTWYDLSGPNRLTFNLAISLVITITWGPAFTNNRSDRRRFECLRRSWNYPITASQAATLREARNFLPGTWQELLLLSYKVTTMLVASKGCWVNGEFLHFHQLGKTDKYSPNGGCMVIYLGRK